MVPFSFPVRKISPCYQDKVVLSTLKVDFSFVSWEMTMFSLNISVGLFFGLLLCSWSTQFTLGGNFDHLHVTLQRNRRGSISRSGNMPSIYNLGASKLIQVGQGGVSKHSTQHNSLSGSKTQIETIFETENNETKSRTEQTFGEIKRISPVNVFKDLQSNRQADLSTENVGTVVSDQKSDSVVLLDKQWKAKGRDLVGKISPPWAILHIKNLHNRRNPLLSDSVDRNKDSKKVVNSPNNKIVSRFNQSGDIDTQSYTTDLHKSIDGSKKVNTIVKSENKSTTVTETTSKESTIKGPIDHIYWSDTLLKSCPKGFTNDDHHSWSDYINGARIVELKEGCGRMQNRLVIFKDSTKACARYRMNMDQIQGEIYSYYLAKLLNITNIPPSSLRTVTSNHQLWDTAHLDLTKSGWIDGKPIVLTKWVENLTPAFIPEQFKGQAEKLLPTMANIKEKSLPELCELVQWSDLSILDYLSANLDRVVNNMFNRQWNPHMMDSPAHNLERSSSGQLVFLDNESGLFHGYRLLEKYSHFHDELLKSVCVFKPSTVRAIKVLHQSGDIEQRLENIFKNNEPNYKSVPVIPMKNMRVLQQRLKDVYHHINNCEQIYA